MGKPLISKKMKKQYKQAIQQVVTDLSEPLTIVQESPMFVDCPNDIWDSINRKSSNFFDSSFTSPVTIFQGTDQERIITPIPFTSGRCPVCLGEGQLFTNKEICINALVNYLDSGSLLEFQSTAAGKEGVNMLRVKVLACHYDLIARNEIFVVHNNIKCEKYRPPFVRGLGGDEAICEVIFQTTEAGQLTTGKFDSSDHPFNSREEDPRRKIKSGSDINILRGRVKGQGG